ncbi:MAG: hypothetical protein Q8O68_00820 [Candidatus Daviesbacteria bacterium]|nr:hypothetical protein [Candidatus Daviesbacteria bacterium]
MVKRIDITPSMFKGKVTSITKEPSNLEGIEQQQYSLEILAENDQYYFEWIPISKLEFEGDVLTSTTLDKFLKEAQTVFPEIKDMQNHEDAFKFLIDKPTTWIRKPLERKIFDIPPKFFLVPTPNDTNNHIQ